MTERRQGTAGCFTGYGQAEGLNYDSEGNPGSFRRHVLMVAAFRKDMGNE